MFWTLLAMLLLVVTGGFISYYGDLQGRRWGKKRVSWFGLRPKHTAILITSITGAVIAFFSVAAVMLVVPNVREIILKGEAAINENQRIRKEMQDKVEALQVNLKQMAAQMATTQAAADEITKAAAKTKLEIATLQQQNSGLEKVNSGLVNGNMDLQRQRAILDRSIQQKQRQVIAETKANEAATLINSQLARQNTNLGRENDNLTHERDKLITSNDALKGTNQKLRLDNTNLTANNTQLKTDKAQLQLTFNAANDAYNHLLDETKDLQGKLTDQKTAYAQLKGQFEDLTQQRDELSNQLAGSSRDFVRAYMDLRQTRYNLRADTELARRTFDSHLSQKAAREELMALLNDASDRARQFGAVVGDNGRAVAIVKKRVVTPASVQVADESASLTALVDQIAGSNTPVVVVARAINNSTAHEQVLMELTPYTSTTLFKPEEVVASRTIDARQPMDKLVNAVIQFLREDVRNAAIKSGTIPQISPETGEEEVGMIDTPEMVTLVDRVRRMGGMVQLTAVANDTITSADLLTFGQSRGGKPHNLRFDLKRPPRSSRTKTETAKR